MEKLIPFVAEQWILISALISCLLLLSFHESKRAGKSITPQQMVSLLNQQGAVVIDLPVVLVCKLGQHSGAAGKKLGAKGYTQVHRLKGGIGEWQAMQMPLVK